MNFSQHRPYILGVLFVCFGICCCAQQNGRKQPAKNSPKGFGSKTNSIGMRIILLPGGSFLMGSNKSEDSRPVHRVVLSPFWIGQYEVTNSQYEQYKQRPRPIESRTKQQPVTRISWNEAITFTRWLSKKEGRNYRLPTEAEWEYAARGGLIQQDYPWPEAEHIPKPETLDFEDMATLGMDKTTAVGWHRPNGFGLYDMSGNVAEWVWDWYDERYYTHSLNKNPKGPVHPKHKIHILRGGSFSLLEGECWMRELWPDSVIPNITQFNNADQSDGTGFRVVMEARPQLQSEVKAATLINKMTNR